MSLTNLQLKTCDRCGFNFRRKKLIRQSGLNVCPDCYDASLDIVPLNIKWGSPRSNSTDTLPVNVPIIYLINGESGITTLQQSYRYSSDGPRNYYVMHVAGYRKPVSITADPAIVEGKTGSVLTLVGTSDTFTVTLATGNGIEIGDPIVLRQGVQLSLAFNSTSKTWHEVSRAFTGLRFYEKPQTAIEYYLLTETGNKLLLETGYSMELE